MRRLLALILYAFLLGVPSLARAQDGAAADPSQTTQKPPMQKPAPKPGLGLRAMGAVELTAMTSTSTFESLVGSANLPGFAGTADVLNIFGKVFIRVGVGQDWKDGSRVIVLDDGSVHQTGVPLTLTVRTIEVGGGWRQYPGRQTKFAWYAGGGAAFSTLHSESPVPQPGDNDSDGGTGFVVFAGFDRTLYKSLLGGLEVQYRVVDDAIGTGGVSQAFGDTSLGGATIRGLIGIRLGR